MINLNCFDETKPNAQNKVQLKITSFILKKLILNGDDES